MTTLVEIQGHSFYLPALAPDSQVFDLGASNAGFAAAVNGLAGCTCHCAEASPSAFGAMIEQPGLHHHNLAIAGRDGPFRMQEGGTVNGRYWVRADTGDSDGAGGVEVEAVTLESFMRRCGVEAPDLVKVDIEGAEIDMFDAASDDTLKSVGQFSVEFHDFLDPALTPRVEAVIRRLQGLGFETVVLTRNGHGDVLFLNRAKIALDRWQLFYMRTAFKYGRGIRRMLARCLGLGARHAA